MVFCNFTDTAVKLAEELATGHSFRKIGLFVQKIGNEERRVRLRQFREGSINLMICTDLLARGIDISDIERVVQFDFSRNIVDHIHRIGRISRAGSRGEAMNFYDDSEQGGRLLAEAIQDVDASPLDALFSRNRGFRKGLKRAERFKQMLLTQGLPLPPHLQGPDDERALPMLSEVLSGLDEDDDSDVDSEDEDVGLLGGEDETDDDLEMKGFRVPPNPS